MRLTFFKTFTLLLVGLFLMASCTETPELESKTITYQFNNGQLVPTAPYSGYHNSNLSATMTISELESGMTSITVALMNTMDGETYPMHAHDAADASTTPNGTPYNESPNGDIFATVIVGNGGTATITEETAIEYDELVNNYEGFFVVHDPLQAVNTADITTYLIVSSFAKDQTITAFDSETFNYDFNTGQIVEAFAYEGTHDTNLSSLIRVDELADGRSRVTVVHNNTMNGMTYATHAHAMADPATTPNGTPYNETPNGDVFAGAILGNGGSIGIARISDMSFAEITTSYDGFFVVHDPLQDIDTTDPTTYLILGVFAR
jgi:hypothetical protein